MFSLTSQEEKLVHYITVKDASKAYGYSPQYLRRLLRKKILKGIQLRQLWIIVKESINNYYLDSHKSLDNRFGPRKTRNFLKKNIPYTKNRLSAVLNLWARRDMSSRPHGYEERILNMLLLTTRIAELTMNTIYFANHVV